jgi:hypothetical protein
MNRTLNLTATAAIACLALTACASSTKPTSGDAATVQASASTATSTAPKHAMMATASQVMATLAQLVPQAKQTIVVTAANDSNHLLGRPNEYTSKVDFSDSRVPASDAQGDNPGDVDFGGSIEVFPSSALAAARIKYIQTVTASIPALSEYDYQAGDAVIRVSHYLTPAQAADYQKAAKTLG